MNLLIALEVFIFALCLCLLCFAAINRMAYGEDMAKCISQGHDPANCYMWVRI